MTVLKRWITARQAMKNETAWDVWMESLVSRIEKTTGEGHGLPATGEMGQRYYNLDDDSYYVWHHKHEEWQPDNIVLHSHDYAQLELPADSWQEVMSTSLLDKPSPCNGTWMYEFWGQVGYSGVGGETRIGFYPPDYPSSPAYPIGARVKAYSGAAEFTPFYTALARYTEYPVPKVMVNGQRPAGNLINVQASLRSIFYPSHLMKFSF